MIAARNRKTAFTLFELLLTLLVLMVVATLVLPAFVIHPTCCRMNCANNLKQIELSFRTWSLDNNDQLPMQVPATNGGAMEATLQGLAFPNFQAVSNELSTPKILVCPQDAKRSPAANFASLSDKQLSYFLCQNPADTGSPGLLIGDRNLTNGPGPGTRTIVFTTTLTLGWTKEMHSRRGNIVFTDGSVTQFQNGAFALKRRSPAQRANRLLVP